MKPALVGFAILILAVGGCATARPLICEQYVKEGWPVLLCVDAADWYDKILPAYGPGPHKGRAVPPRERI